LAWLASVHLLAYCVDRSAIVPPVHAVLTQPGPNSSTQPLKIAEIRHQKHYPHKTPREQQLALHRRRNFFDPPARDT
jgi:hypothetical protein